MDMVGTSLSLLMLVVLLLVAGTLAWRRRGGLSAGKSSSRLKTLAITPIGPRDRLLLIECDSQRFLLAQGPAGLTLIDRVADVGADSSYEAVALVAASVPGEIR